MLDESITDLIHKDVFKSLCEQHGLSVSGDKPHLIERINQKMINEVEIQEEVSESLIKSLKYGRNNITIILDINYPPQSNLNNKEVLLEDLKNNQYEMENFNDLLELEDVTEGAVSHLFYQNFNYEEDEKSIEMGFYFSQAPSVSKNKRKVSGFIFVTIDLKLSKILISFGNIILDNFFDFSTANKIFNYYFRLLTKKFQFSTEDTSYMKRIMYKIYKDLTENIEKPLLEELEPYNEAIVSLSENFSAGYNYDLADDELQIIRRIKGVLLRVMIMSKQIAYNDFYNSDLGTIEAIYFSDTTGANVTAKTNEKEVNINNFEIYFDIRDTLDILQRLAKLKFLWKINNPDIDRKNVSVKIESHSEFYIIHTMGRYVTEEVFNFVFSKIREIE